MNAVARSYRYVRLSMVGLLLALIVAVVVQTFRQDDLLGSVSAYYYTPARTVFVASLIGLGTCMIALRGRGWEDVWLNLGGVAAMVVAIVPTPRRTDLEQAVQACTGTTSVPCPDASALAVPSVTDVVRDDVVVGVWTLVATAVVALLVTLVLLRLDPDPAAGPESRIGFLLVAGLVTGIGLFAWLAFGTFVTVAHFGAAGLLLVMIVLVAWANAEQRREPRLARGLVRPGLYRGTALAIVGATAAAVLLWGLAVFSLFWVELVVGVAFAAFWTVQTFSAPEVTAAAQPATEPA